MLGKPLVYGSIFRFEGQVSVFGMKAGPCYRCLLPTPPPPHLVPSCAQAGVLGILPGTIGTIQATEALKLILGIGESLVGKLLLYDALDMTFDMIRLPKRANCPMCGSAPSITELIDYEEFCGMPAHTPNAPGARRLAVPQQSAREVKARLDAGEHLVLVDVREPFELAISRLEGTLDIPMSQLGTRWQEIPRDQPVVVFCHTGVRSANAILQLQALGYTSLINMAGGIDAWSRDIDPSVPVY
jgi:adenylyltransferase/sulfurtransferase